MKSSEAEEEVRGDGFVGARCSCPVSGEGEEEVRGHG